MSKRKENDSDNVVSRRTVVAQLGLGAVAIAGCSSDALSEASETAPPAPPRDTQQPNDQQVADAATTPDASRVPTLTPEELLAPIDTIVVLMMENRSFDHFLGALQLDAKYANRTSIKGLSGKESNADKNGNDVVVHQFTDFTPEDLPHDWDAVHSSWNDGKNDGFVKAHAGANERDTMGYHDRSQIPFYYWLADNYTVCDNWFASVLGPTWPNRYYLHACTAGGKKSNNPILTSIPDTVWDRMKSVGKSYKNYYAGAAAWYLGGFIGKLATMNPTAPISDFFSAAKAGKLPNFSLIDPDFLSSDDHPSHDVRKGQAFVATVYEALAQSPQWDRLLFIITYDEHGGFFDHVPPPSAKDEYVEFQQRGFRVPALVIGGRAKRGAVVSTTFEHSSVAATLKTRFNIANLSNRMADTNDLSSCIDPLLVAKPQAAATGMPVVAMNLQQALADRVGESSQPELERMIADGTIPKAAIDTRSHADRIGAWMKEGHRLGAIRIL